MAKNKLAKKRRRYDVFEWLCFTLILVYVISLMGLLGFGFFNSFKHKLDFYDNVFGWPRERFGGFIFDNYLFIFDQFRVPLVFENGTGYAYLEHMLFNSLAWCILVSIFMIGTQVIVAYACAKYDFRGKGVIYTVAIIVMMIPIIGSLPSEMQLATDLGLVNSFIGMAIMCCRYPGIYFLVFYSSFKNVSSSYMEAAEIDGAGHLQIFLQIMLPMIGNMIAAVFVLQFISNFNNYQTPMLFLPERPTVSYGLYLYKSSPEDGVGPTNILAASIATAVPLMILFFIFRNKIMGNVTMGGIKG